MCMRQHRLSALVGTLCLALVSAGISLSVTSAPTEVRAGEATAERIAAASESAGKGSDTTGDAADIAESKREKIRRLAKMSNARASALAAMQQTLKRAIPALKRKHPGINAEVETKLKNAIREVFQKNIDAYIEGVIPIYAEHFSEAEIEKMIAFYESPVGRKLSRLTPVMTEDIVAVVQTWSRSLRPQVRESIQKVLENAEDA